MSRWKSWSRLRPGSVEMLRFEMSAFEASNIVNLGYNTQDADTHPFQVVSILTQTILPRGESSSYDC